MKKSAFFVLLALSSSVFASESERIFSSLGEIYVRTEGKCDSYMDIMRWEVQGKEGTRSFAQTNSPKLRPLRNYSQIANISAKNLLPLGEGEYRMEPNQFTPIKAEYEYEGDDKVTIYAHNKGKGSSGGMFGDGPHFSWPGTNQTFSYEFTRKENGIYQNLKTTYQNLKGVFKSKKVVCKFTLQK